MSGVEIHVIFGIRSVSPKTAWNGLPFLSFMSFQTTWLVSSWCSMAGLTDKPASWRFPSFLSEMYNALTALFFWTRHQFKPRQGFKLIQKGFLIVSASFDDKKVRFEFLVSEMANWCDTDSGITGSLWPVVIAIASSIFNLANRSCIINLSLICDVPDHGSIHILTFSYPLIPREVFPRQLLWSSASAVGSPSIAWLGHKWIYDQRIERLISPLRYCFVSCRQEYYKWFLKRRRAGHGTTRPANESDGYGMIWIVIVSKISNTERIGTWTQLLPKHLHIWGLLLGQYWVNKLVISSIFMFYSSTSPGFVQLNLQSHVFVYFQHDSKHRKHHKLRSLSSPPSWCIIFLRAGPWPPGPKGFYLPADVGWMLALKKSGMYESHPRLSFFSGGI